MTGAYVTVMPSGLADGVAGESENRIFENIAVFDTRIAWDLAVVNIVFISRVPIVAVLISFTR